MARDFNGTTQYLTKAEAVTGLSSNTDNYSVHVVVYPDSVTGTHNVWSTGDSIFGYASQLRSGGANWDFYHYSPSSGFDANARHTSGVSTGAWQVLGCSWSGSQIKLYTFGVLRQTTAAVDHSRCGNNHSIGCDNNEAASPQNFFDGRIAEFAVWNVALSDDEFFALADGFSPLLVRPSSLTSYVPLIRSLNDQKRAAWTDNGTTTVIEHPRVFYPSSQQQRRTVAPAVGGTAVKDLIANTGLLAGPR